MGLLVSDFDGTFSTSIEDIRLNCYLIERYIKNGNYFLLSSGRPYDSLLHQVRKYDIPYTHLGTSDGSFLFNRDGKMIQMNRISRRVIDIIEDLKKINIYKSIQYAYPRENAGVYKGTDNLASIAFVVRGENITNEFLEAYNELKEREHNYQFDVYGYNGIYYYMIRPLGISKSTTVKFLETRLHINKKKIYTIGDNNNDFEMIRDYNGFMIGNNEDVEKVALRKYNAVHELVSDISKKKALKRW